jgi:hypothetical protein
MWAIEDVEKHKAGLSARGKKQWVRVSNSVLKRMMDKGMTEKEAAAMAIKQANGVVINANAGSYSVYKNKQKLDYEVNFVVHQEKAHIVIPVVMMVEGVHSGNQGAIYHSIEELGKVPASWNGIPVVINHPEEDGQAISANSPDIIDSVTVGRVYNTTVEGNKLKAEVWLDEDKLNAVSEKVLMDINETKEVEVSLGMFTDNEATEGDWNGEKYVMIAKNHRPDHLAILPDAVGACSCEDGCGLGANKKKVIVPDDENDDDEDDLMTDKKDLSQKKGKCKDIQSSSKGDAGVEVNGKLINLNKEVNIMADNKCPKCLEKVNALIANTASKFDETDKEWLLTQDEKTLDKLAPVVKEVEKIVEKTVEVNKLTPDQTADLQFVANMRAAQRNERIQTIQANTSKELWPDEVLKGMNEDTLKRIFDSVKKEEVQANYSLNANVQSNTGGVEAMYPAGVETKN